MTEVVLVKQQPRPSPSPDHADEDTPSDPLPGRERPGTPSLLYYQLRRIGAEASIEGIKDVFKLTKPRTILGRNASEVDCFVDSSVHTRLISRQHAEILMEMDENQSPMLYVLDRSLNGTFVNDVKLTSKTKVQLKEGDTLTLGHLRGVQVMQGTYAEQPNSEFRFRLVYAPLEDDATEDEENTPSKRKNKESPKVSKKTRILHPPDSNVSPPTSQSANRPFSMAPPFLQPNNRVDSNGDPSSSHQDGETNGLDEEENTQPTMGLDSWRGKQKRGSGRGTARGSARGRGATRGLGRRRGSMRGLGLSRGRGRGKGDPERLEAKEPQNQETGNKAAEEFQFEELESESGNEEDADLHRQVDAICQRSLSNSDSDSAKGRPGPSDSDSAKGRPGPSKPGPYKGNVSKNGRTSKPEPKGTDKKKGESAPSKQNLRKKGTVAAKKDDIEYNSLPCSSAKCIRPENSMVSWVQCDDCDDWYHVTCVGCDYNKVKRADYQFHCGCKRKTRKK